MLSARSLQWFYLLVLLSVTTVLAAEETQAANDCDWYCWVEKKINSLEKQVDKITKLLFPDVDNNTSTSIDDNAPNAPTGHPRYPSSFGAPYASITANHGVAKLISRPIVTVTPTGRTPIATSTPSEPKPDVQARAGYRSLAYFGNWDIYGRKYFPQQVPAEKLTHLLYSFADIKSDGTVVLTDTYADTDIHYQGDSWSDSGNNVYGAVNQLAMLKARNRNMKVMLSIGGWTYTNTNKHLDTPASTAQGRQAFAASCVDMVKNYGFDGIDIDWEYPQNTTQGSQFLAMLTEMRSQLDDYAETLVYADAAGRKTKPHFLISMAAPAGDTNYRLLPLGKIAAVLDFINLMAYDYAGSWDKTSGHASNLYASTSNPLSTPFNTYGVVNAYIAAGVPSAKLNLGMPLYGRAFTKTRGPGLPYDGIGDGTWEKGVYDFKDLPLKGAKEYYSKEAGATFSYDNSTGMFISYDTLNMALRKVDYIKQNKLGGAMWWEVSGDRTDKGSIITNVVRGLGGSDGSGIESSSNWLAYPDSQYDNIKNAYSH
ncbi:glycoside hydrolase family 18 protein [Cucurbitaria berberidis CBS 394.84]|uniref:chitinase n=1 Tax=Cucurbitaria berberidis CBS 394.84 TaxID=1168544 RepID=A0A9P4GEL3_9PLEO|nr:glycoside hydrolase family 18 protein [Cucurbitaria berberidis CBS 394.84]KAF1843942.1 glycoside hydrolase family 18 protein [Cucurbitaria berberidis CBS 394.84]